MFSRFTRWFSTPSTSPLINRRNFVNVQIDAVGVALASAAAPFLPVFLARLGASNFQVSLLTAMPAVTGILLAIPLGRILQGKRQIVPWFSGARLLVIMCYAFTGLVSFVLPLDDSLINAILTIWAIATLPQTIVAISFAVVMNAVAGPDGRYELMTRRWSILGLTTSITVFIIGQILDRIVFPLNYQLVFVFLSIGGLISYYFSSHITIPDSVVKPQEVHGVMPIARSYIDLIKKEVPFIRFISKRFVYLFGISLATPLFPIFFVRVINASDSWIAAINTAQTFVMVFGYFFWTRQSRKRGPRFVLLWTTFGVAIYPILTAISQAPWQITIFAGMAGIFQAGLDLVFFDELLRTFPPEYSATFIAVSQSATFLSTIIAPIVGSSLAGWIGVGPVLVIGGVLRLAGFFLFAQEKKQAAVEFSPTQG